VKYLGSRCIGRAFSFFIPAFIVFFGSLTATAQVNNYYVSPSGSDANDGSQGRPWRTIQHAVSSASLSGGAILNVAAGTYSDIQSSCAGYPSPNVCVNRGGPSISNRLVIKCTAGWSVPSGSGCLLRGGAREGVVVTANNVDVIGFDIGNNASEFFGLLADCNPGVNGPCATGNSVHFINNYVHDIAQTADSNLGFGPGCPSEGAIAGQQHHGANITDFQVIGNRVSNYGNTALGIRNGGRCNQAQGIYPDASGAIIQNNIVLDVVGYGIHYYSNACNGTITNNTVVRVGASGIVVAGGDFCTTPGTFTITNNIVDVSGRYGIQMGTAGGTAPCTSSTPILISNNIGSGNPLGNIGQTNSCSIPTNTFSEPPAATFTNYLGNSSDDYHLKTSSIAVNQGATVCVTGKTGCLATVDFDGLARSSTPSIGVFELSSAGSAPAAPVGLTASVQ
jgi:hypothetical protein